MNDALESVLPAGSFSSTTGIDPQRAPRTGRESFDEGIRSQVQRQLAAASDCFERLLQSGGDEARARECDHFQKALQALETSAANAGMRAVALEASALGSFLKELFGKTELLTDSRLCTLSQAVEVLGELIGVPDPREGPVAHAAAVIVDKERLSSSAASNALRKAGFEPCIFSEPAKALKHLGSNPAGLLVVDATTVAQSNVDFYKMVRELPNHGHTPLISLTGGGDTRIGPGRISSFDTQFLGKPCTMLNYWELALKAVSHVLDSRQASQPEPTGPSKFSPWPTRSERTDLPEQSPSPNSAMNTAQKDSMKTNAKHDRAPIDSFVETETVAALKNRILELEGELAGAQRMCEEANREFAAEKAAQETRFELGQAEKLKRGAEASPGGDSPAVDRRLRESAVSCARLTADLEKERAERRRIEQRAGSMASQLEELHGQLKNQFESERQNQQRFTELERRVRESEESLARTSAELQKEKEAHQLATEQMCAHNEMVVQLGNCVTSFETAKQAFERAQTELDSRLQACLKTSSEQEERLQKETAERQRGEEALRSLREQSQKSALELATLQAALEVQQAERNHLQGEAIQARYASLDGARTALALGNKIRRQVREPVENLMQMTRHLMESPLEEAAKKLVDSVLENVLLLQSSLEDLGELPATPAGPTAGLQNSQSHGESRQSSGTGSPGQELAAA